MPYTCLHCDCVGGENSGKTDYDDEKDYVGGVEKTKSQ